MQIDLSRFRESFFQESAEHLADMEAGLLQLEQGSSDPELLNSVFRAAHSIKGSSGMFGLEDIARFTHALESLLDRLRSAESEVTSRRTDVLLRSCDVLRELLERASAGAPAPPRMDAVLAELYVAQRANPPSGDAPLHIRTTDRAVVLAHAPLFRVHFKPAGEIFAQGMDPLLVLRDLARMGESVVIEVDLAALPALANLDPERCYLAWNICLTTSKTREEILDLFAFVEDGAEIRVEAEAGTTVANESKAEGEAAPLPAPSQAGLRDASIRVATSKVDKLIDLVGELVIAQSMARQVVDNFSMSRLGQLQEAVAAIERHLGDLQERVMSVRMLPISHVFGRFPRLLRDISGKLGKDVRLEVSGEETELDKSIVEQISDPLTHLIRNAIDHGIETPGQRRDCGKPPQGVIQLSAFHQAGSVVIEVSDDGRGLDPMTIRRKAIERGLVTEAEALSQEQICDLVFIAGFSTAGQVTGLSGRGVGMDVVKRNVARLKGSVSLTSQPGLGTTVRIKLPLTLGILDGLTLRVGEETYILPLVSIVESIRPRGGDISNVAGQGEVMLVRGKALPLVRLHRLFGVPTEVMDQSRGLAVIVELGGHSFALLVDELLGQQQVVIKSLEANFRKVEGVLGATILADGRAALILDAAGLAELARRAGAGERAA